MPTTGELLGRYLDSMRSRRCSPNTIKSVRYTLTGFSRILGKRLDEVTPADFQRWHENDAVQYGTRTHRNYFSMIHTFYAWAVIEGHVPVDPTARCRAPRARRPLPRPIPEDRLAHALAEADARTFAILALAAFAGLRAIEIARLGWGDVELDGHAASPPRAWVLGKGNREGLVYLSTDLVSALRALPGAGTGRGPVIRRAYGGGAHLTPNAISHIANHHLHDHGIPDTLHSLRHRFVTEFTRAAGLRRAQEAARHADASTTAGYAAVTREELADYTELVGRLLPPPTRHLRSA